MALTTTPSGALDIEPIASIDLVGAEIVSFSPQDQRAFVTSSSGLSIIDLSDPAAPVLIELVDFTAPPFNFTNEINSVAVALFGGRDTAIAVAVAADPKTNPGKVFIIDPAGNLLTSVDVGANPDHLTFISERPDGSSSKILVANEGEIAADGTDPEGSVTIIDIAVGIGAAFVNNVSTATFTGFNDDLAALRAEGVRLFAGTAGTQFADTSVAQDLEPEYIAIAPDGLTAFVTLEEANAVAILDIASSAFTDIVPLGLKDFSSLPVDTSDRDGPAGEQSIDLETGDPVFGLYMPDAIASFTGSDGNTYYAVANEGDDRDDFLADGETIRVGDPAYDLDDTLFPNEAELKTDAELGRLTVSNFPGLNGDTDGDGDIDQILAYGGRSFSILDADGNRVFDSGTQIDQFLATVRPDLFPDGRSDNKGAEPEGVSVGIVGDRTYAFVTLERGQGTMVYDVTDPAEVTFVEFATRAGDEEPEIAKFVSAEDSPTGEALLLVANEGSNTLTIQQIEDKIVDETVDYTLQLLHFSDAEAGLLAPNTAPNLAALVDAFEDDFANSITLAGGDNFLPGPFLAAGTDPSLSELVPGNSNPGRIDISIFNRIGVEVSGVGNHEFDLGSGVLDSAISGGRGYEGALFPYITANLDFSGDSALADNYTDTVGAGLEEANTLGGRMAPSAVITENGEAIGFVGVTTQLLENISSPSGTEVEGFPTGEGSNGETNDMELLAAQLQPVIDDLIAQGVNKIVLTSHLQQIELEQELATLLTGVDVILAAGSNTRLGDADDEAIAFPGHSGEFEGAYPITTQGADGKTTLIVNTDSEFTYLGRLVVDFDANGDIILGGNTTNTAVNGAYASTDENVAEAWETSVDNLEITAFAEGTRGNAVRDLTDAVNAVIQEKDSVVYGYTNVYLEGERSEVRGQETNLGNLTADANGDAARDALGIDGVTQAIVSIKNGGGIRAQIGTLTDDGNGGAVKSPPQDGEISQLDVESALRFNNRLMVFDTTPEGLLAILNGPTATSQGNGGFIQLGGVRFSFDPDLPEGERVQDVALTNEAGEIVHIIADNGRIVPGAPQSIQAVILNFTANGGDGYPIKENGSNFRFLLDDGTVSAPVDESLSFTDSAVVPANALGEQQALADYLGENFATPETAYDEADTGAAADERTQNLNERTDGVFDRDAFRDTPIEEDQLRRGTDDDDNIGLKGGNDRLYGGGGNDLLNGGLGDDLISGDDGNDKISGREGNDVLYGVLGDDRLGGRSGDDILFGGDGADRINGGFDNDLLYGEAGADFLLGDAGNDQMFGGAGDELLMNGNGGDDLLVGGEGRDRMRGENGDDVLRGGEGADIMRGDDGADRYDFNAVTESNSAATDQVQGFTGADGDRIDLVDIDAILGTDANDAFTIVDGFSGNAGELTIRAAGVNIFQVNGDVDGDGMADFTLNVRSTEMLTAADFLL